MNITPNHLPITDHGLEPLSKYLASNVKASRVMIVARLPAHTAIVHERLHIPKPELTKIISVEHGTVEGEACKFGPSASLTHLLHLTVLEMLLMGGISAVTEGSGWMSWRGSVLEDCYGTCQNSCIQRESCALPPCRLATARWTATAPFAGTLPVAPSIDCFILSFIWPPASEPTTPSLTAG